MDDADRLTEILTRPPAPPRPVDVHPQEGHGTCWCGAAAVRCVVTYSPPNRQTRIPVCHTHTSRGSGNPR